MGTEVIQGIFLGLAAVVATVLVGVYVTLGNTMILVGAGIAAALTAIQWYFYTRGEKASAE